MKKYVYKYYLDCDYIMTSIKKKKDGTLTHSGRVNLVGKERLGNVLNTHTWTPLEFEKYKKTLHESIHVRVVSKTKEK